MKTDFFFPQKKNRFFFSHEPTIDVDMDVFRMDLIGHIAYQPYPI